MFERLQQRAAARTQRFLGRLRRDDKGVAAVEFGLIVPVMFLLFVGAIEFSQALTVDRRVTQSASSSADLIARAPAEGLTPAEVDGHLKIIEQLIKPYELGPLTVTVYSVKAIKQDGNLKFLVDWSRDNKGMEGPIPHGNPFPDMPENLLGEGESVIIAEADYNYTPLIFSYFITSAFHMKEKFYLKPRNASCITLRKSVTSQCATMTEG